MSPALQHYSESEAEAIGKLRDAFNIFFSSPCFFGLHPDQLADRVACAIPTSSPGVISSIYDDRGWIASRIVNLVWQARLKDPLAVLSTDVGVHLMSFFKPADVALMREVSQEWCKAGNARLAQEQRVLMKANCDGGIRQSLVQFVSRRHPSLRSLTIDLFGTDGYTAQDAHSLFSRCRDVRSVGIRRGSGNNDGNLDITFGFTPLVSIALAGAFRSLTSLQAALYMSDADADGIVGQLPCLRALCLHWPGRVLPDVPSNLMLSSRGVASLINGFPSLTVLYIDSLAHICQPFPACRSGIRRLWLGNITTTVEAFQSLLAHVGSDLRTLAIACSQLTDECVQRIADSCPQLESLDFGAGHPNFVTPACLHSLAQLAKLRDICLDPDKFSDTHMDWLMQHTRSPASKDYKKRLREYGSVYGVYKAIFSFSALQMAEGLDVYDTSGPC